MLDQEATDSEDALADRPDIQIRWAPSHEANKPLINQLTQYRSTLSQAARSDEAVRVKWQEWSSLVGILGGGQVRVMTGVARFRSDSFSYFVRVEQDAVQAYIPSTKRSGSNGELPPSARDLRASLEELDDGRGYRERLVAEARRTAERDDIRPVVLQEAARLAHGGSGDVKPEWFEQTFDKELRKYQRLVEEMENHCAKQSRLLDSVKVRYDQVFFRSIISLYPAPHTEPEQYFPEGTANRFQGQRTRTETARDGASVLEMEGGHR